MPTAFAALCAVSLCAFADSGDVKMTVEQLTGSNFTQAISAISHITSKADGKLYVVATDGSVLYEVDASNVKRLVFGDAADALTDIVVPDEAVAIIPEPATQSVRIIGLADGEPVRIYSLSGAVEIVGSAPVVSVAGLPQGVHIVVAGKAAAKITIK